MAKQQQAVQEEDASYVITVDGADVILRKFAELETHLIELRGDLVREFTDWQIHDMKRKYPTVDEESVAGQAVVATSIFPRSRLKRVHKGPKGKSNVRRRARVALARQGGQRRPILRPELFNSLVKRITGMVEGALKWP